MAKFDFREDDHNEFKAKWTDKALEDIAAFSNTQGGVVWIGVTDNGEVVGCDTSQKEIDRITNKIRNKLGSVSFHVDVQNQDGKEFLQIEVKKGKEVIGYKGFLIRVMGTNQPMTDSERDMRLLQQSGRTWDAILSEIDITEVDKNEVAHFQTLALEEGRIPEPSKDPLRILQHLNLVKGDRLTNAGVLLFTANPQSIFPGTEIQVAQFRGDDVILDSISATGPIMKQLESVLAFLRQVVGVRFEIDAKEANVQGLQRKEVWPYPLRALREAILNAIAHRDYTIPVNIQIKVLDDRLVIWNPGRLPEGLNPERLYQEHRSLPRNPLLAGALYRVGLIEKWGTGTVKMVELFKEQGLPKPIFEEMDNGFRVVLLKDPYTVENLRSQGVKDRQIQALLYMKENGRITNKQYRELVKISDEAARKDLAELVEMGLISRHGRGRGTRYELSIT